MPEQSNVVAQASAEPGREPAETLEKELTALAARARRAGYWEAGHFAAVAAASIAENKSAQAV